MEPPSNPGRFTPATVAELADGLEGYRKRRATIAAKNAEAAAALVRSVPAGRPAIEGGSPLESLMVGEDRPEWHRGVFADLMTERGVPRVDLEGSERA